MIRLDPGPVLEVVLDRPAQRNALTPEMLEAIASVDPASERAGAVLLRGEGNAFCAGFDLGLCARGDRAMATLLSGLSRAVRAMRAWPLPVVACVHGAAIAGGCALLGGADVVVADADAKLGYPVVRLGVSPAVTAPYLRLAVGDGAMRELLLRPDLIDGRRALDLGLVHELADSPAEALERARTIAAELAAKPGAALKSTRAWMGEIESAMGPNDAAERGLAASLALAGSEQERSLLARAMARRGA